MTEENKYYVPKNEDLFIGLEYERQDFDDENVWHKEVIKFDYGWLEISEDFASDIRIKYLDRQDIESLGWKGATEYNNLVVFHNADRLLIFNLEKHFVKITGIVGSAKSQYDWDSLNAIFDGTIKNINELKRIMKMLGII